LCGLADAVDALRSSGVVPRRVLLIGGAAANPAVRGAAATIFDVPVEVPTPGQYVARGAARQAAWAIQGGDCPDWPVATEVRIEPVVVPGIRTAYAAARELFFGRAPIG
jgi:xylulokinase